MRTPASGDTLLLSFASNLSDSDINRLRALLTQDAGLREVRLQLMGAQRAPMPVRVAQVCWFAENEPRTFLGLYGGMATLGAEHVRGEHYEDAKACWFAAMSAHPDDMDVVENAAWFMILAEPTLGGELLASRCPEGDLEWSYRAFAYFDAAAGLHPDSAASFAGQAVQAGYRIFRTEKNAERAFGLTLTMFQCAKRASMDDAARMLRVADRASSAWSGAGSTGRVQIATAVRGLVALAGGDIAHAESEFARGSAVDAYPSEAMLAFAAELVGLGALDVVTSAVESWRVRFTRCADALGDWMDRLRRGEQVAPPKLPPT